MPCEAKMFSDRTICIACGLQWDTNDPAPPACKGSPGCVQKERMREDEKAAAEGAIREAQDNLNKAYKEKAEAKSAYEELRRRVQAQREQTKESNPKDAVGVSKAPMSTVPAGVLLELGVAMLEGARKYGRHNYRTVGVRSSVYYDAAMRHLMAWWEGEDFDPDSGMPHITKALASLTVLRDAQRNGMVEDDRPPPEAEPHRSLNEMAARLIEQHPNAKPPHTRK